eukprot:187574-Pleurochrysis_carterae.AAC.2
MECLVEDSGSALKRLGVVCMTWRCDPESEWLCKAVSGFYDADRVVKNVTEMQQDAKPSSNVVVWFVDNERDGKRDGKQVASTVQQIMHALNDGKIIILKSFKKRVKDEADSSSCDKDEADGSSCDKDEVDSSRCDKRVKTQACCDKQI